MSFAAIEAALALDREFAEEQRQLEEEASLASQVSAHDDDPFHLFATPGNNNNWPSHCFQTAGRVTSIAQQFERVETSYGAGFIVQGHSRRGVDGFISVKLDWGGMAFIHAESVEVPRPRCCRAGAGKGEEEGPASAAKKNEDEKQQRRRRPRRKSMFNSLQRCRVATVVSTAYGYGRIHYDHRTRKWRRRDGIFAVELDWGGRMYGGKNSARPVVMTVYGRAEVQSRRSDGFDILGNPILILAVKLHCWRASAFLAENCVGLYSPTVDNEDEEDMEGDDELLEDDGYGNYPQQYFFDDAMQRFDSRLLPPGGAVCPGDVSESLRNHNEQVEARYRGRENDDDVSSSADELEVPIQAPRSPKTEEGVTTAAGLDWSLPPTKHIQWDAECVDAAQTLRAGEQMFDTNGRAVCAISSAYVGTGRFGHVYETLRLETEELQAVKVIRTHGMPRNERAEMESSLCFEAALGQWLGRHPNLAGFIDLAHSNDSGSVRRQHDSYLVFSDLLIGQLNLTSIDRTFDDDASNYFVELHHYGSRAYEHYDGQGPLYREGSRALTATRIERFALQLARGLAHCHRHSVVHGDIRPKSTVMVTVDGTHLKITDFSSASVARGATGSTTLTANWLSTRTADDANGVGVPDFLARLRSGGTFRNNSSKLIRVTPTYRSPEIAALTRALKCAQTRDAFESLIDDAPITAQSDMWSFALTILHLYAGGICWPIGRGEKANRAFRAYLRRDSSVTEWGLRDVQTFFQKQRLKAFSPKLEQYDAKRQKRSRPGVDGSWLLHLTSEQLMDVVGMDDEFDRMRLLSAIDGTLEKYPMFSEIQYLLGRIFRDDSRRRPVSMWRVACELDMQFGDEKLPHVGDERPSLEELHAQLPTDGDLTNASHDGASIVGTSASAQKQPQFDAMSRKQKNAMERRHVTARKHLAHVDKPTLCRYLSLQECSDPCVQAQNRRERAQCGADPRRRRLKSTKTKKKKKPLLLMRQLHELAVRRERLASLSPPVVTNIQLADTLHLIARVQMRNGWFDEAEDSLEQALRAAPRGTTQRQLRCLVKRPAECQAVWEDQFGALVALGDVRMEIHRVLMERIASANRRDRAGRLITAHATELERRVEEEREIGVGRSLYVHGIAKRDSALAAIADCAIFQPRHNHLAARRDSQMRVLAPGPRGPNTNSFLQANDIGPAAEVQRSSAATAANVTLLPIALEIVPKDLAAARRAIAAFEEAWRLEPMNTAVLYKLAAALFALHHAATSSDPSLDPEQLMPVETVLLARQNTWRGTASGFAMNCPAPGGTTGDRVLEACIQKYQEALSQDPVHPQATRGLAVALRARAMRLDGRGGGGGYGEARGCWSESKQVGAQAKGVTKAGTAAEERHLNVGVSPTTTAIGWHRAL